MKLRQEKEKQKPEKNKTKNRNVNNLFRFHNAHREMQSTVLPQHVSLASHRIVVDPACPPPPGTQQNHPSKDHAIDDANSSRVILAPVCVVWKNVEPSISSYPDPAMSVPNPRSLGPAVRPPPSHLVL